jgi:hypothetical protein
MMVGNETVPSRAALAYTALGLVESFRFVDRSCVDGALFPYRSGYQFAERFSWKGAVIDVGRYHSYLPRLRPGLYI